MQLFSEKKQSYQSLYEKLGLLFQIRDDYANLFSKEVSFKDSLSQKTSFENSKIL
jgi:geranylgeranyl pyrophosphate synthase